jgi:hypothetical protein
METSTFVIPLAQRIWPISKPRQQGRVLRHGFAFWLLRNQPFQGLVDHTLGDCFVLLWGPPFNSVSDLVCKPSTIRSTSNKGPGSMRGNIAAGDAGERGAVNYFKHAIFPMNCLSEEQPLERLVCMHQ